MIGYDEIRGRFVAFGCCESGHKNSNITLVGPGRWGGGERECQLRRRSFTLRADSRNPGPAGFGPLVIQRVLAGGEQAQHDVTPLWVLQNEPDPRRLDTFRCELDVVEWNTQRPAPFRQGFHVVAAISDHSPNPR